MTKRILFVLAAVILAGAGTYFRSVNAKHANDRVKTIVAADLAGQDVAADLAELKSYVGLHMGTSVSFTLDGSYARAQTAAKTAAAASAANSQIYADAQRVCAGKSNSITQAKCNEDYLSKHLVSQPVVAVTDPKKADFRQTVSAPFFTPDLTGSLFLGALVSLGMGVYYFIKRGK